MEIRSNKTAYPDCSFVGTEILITDQWTECQGPSSGKVWPAYDKNRANRSQSVQRVQKQGEAFPLEKR